VSLPIPWRLNGFNGAHLEVRRPFEFDEIIELPFNRQHTFLSLRLCRSDILIVSVKTFDHAGTYLDDIQPTAILEAHAKPVTPSLLPATLLGGEGKRVLVLGLIHHFKRDLSRPFRYQD